MISKKSEAARKLEQEVERNYKEFLKMSFGELDRGKWALLKDGKIVELLIEKQDADKMGAKLFPDGIYSIQQIGALATDLGYMSYAVRSN